ncbi:ZYRO0F06028p [Zygosaccharomyces rouxii]|uniref:ZYRO0F06028p n=1 Tax=Zygosaccharomyces rouxii (strain ATCC 2623 / CBS 732 / NBRC 1130 / NCYC 568 / NRRL Y-229) TaxID=559307 RepID=C5DXL5_ZYGRC|nr:uncharacterized protein ZYRO0F06028g [Zygosaccharomyces rouxii]KAH9199286.1 6-phosphogluconate dehydrogenase [Zygosaccharomyces rouxii]CAR28526.1 ZYRO0F06028p [Zygosaccharomyces rouxii]
MGDSCQLPKVIVIGAGGVGIIGALSLCYKGLSNVSLAIRSDYEIVQKKGYKISSCDYGQFESWKPNHVYRTVEDASQSGQFFDYIVVATKNIPDGPAHSRVPKVIQPLVESNHALSEGRQTNVLLIQNGIDIEKEIWNAFDRKKYHLNVLSGIQLIGSTKVAPGVIDHVGKDQLQVGAFESENEDAVKAAKRFVELYHNEGKNYAEFDASVRYSRWKKLLYNAAINTTTSLVNLDVPRCLEFGVDRKSTEENVFRPAMREIVAIATTENIVLDESLVTFFVEITRHIMFKPSMCVDHEKGQLMELEVILGNPLKIARENGVQTPVLSMLYYLLVMVQGHLREKNGLLKFDESKAELVETK